MDQEINTVKRWWLKVAKDGVKLWEWRGVFLTVIVVTLLFSFAYCFRQESFPDSVKIALNAAVVIALGVILAVEQRRFTRGITKRQEYSTAIEHLSSFNPAVRLKGVEALHQRAEKTQDSNVKKEVWSLLNGHVRHYTQDTNYQKSFPEKPSVDIQRVIDIQGCRGKYKESDAFSDIRSEAFFDFRSEVRIDWGGAWLRGAMLADAQLQGAYLGEAQLQRADLWGVQLQGADLWGAQLQEADFLEAQLQRACLEGAHLQKVNLKEVRLQGAKLARVELQGAYLAEAQFQGADLWGAQLQGAYLGGVWLQGARLYNIQLQGAYSNASAYYENKKSFRAFEKKIKDRLEEDAELDDVVLKGGLEKFSIGSIRDAMDLDAEYWGNQKQRELREILDDLTNNHCGERISGSSEEGRRILEENNATLGSYSQEEAEQWIKKFNEAVKVD